MKYIVEAEWQASEEERGVWFLKIRSWVLAVVVDIGDEAFTISGLTGTYKTLRSAQLAAEKALGMERVKE